MVSPTLRFALIVCRGPRTDDSACVTCGALYCENNSEPNEYLVALFQSLFLVVAAAAAVAFVFFFYYFGFHHDVNIGLFLLSYLSMALCVSDF